MKKIFLVLFLTLCFCLTPMCQDFSVAEVREIIVNTAYTHLYKNPSYDEFYEFLIPSGEMIICNGIQEDFYSVTYYYEDSEYTGYIPLEFASVYSPEQEKILVYNGKITKETAVYSITTDEKLEDILLKSGHEIYLYEGFDSKKEYTSVKFSYNGKIITAKVPTKNLSPNGINKAVIIGASAIVALVGVVLIVLGLKKRKKKWHTFLKKSK